LFWFAGYCLHFNHVSVSNRNTSQHIVIEHWPTKTNFAPAARKPIFAPRNNQWVRHIRICCYSGNERAWKTSGLCTGISMYRVTRVLWQILRFDRPLNNLRPIIHVATLVV
jgi:hypothetical protein